VRVNQDVYRNKVTKQVVRADPAKVLQAAQAAYDDAWEFTTNYDDEADAAAVGRFSTWQEHFHPDYQCVYWYNASTGTFYLLPGLWPNTWRLHRP
jgi:hypothetical protein